MSRRIKISGAQWNEKNVPQVLAHRSAYLKGFIGAQKDDMLPCIFGIVKGLQFFIEGEAFKGFVSTPGNYQ